MIFCVDVKIWAVTKLKIIFVDGNYFGIFEFKTLTEILMENSQIQELYNQTFSGLTFFYRDSQLDDKLVSKYMIGQMDLLIFRSKEVELSLILDI